MVVIRVWVVLTLACLGLGLVFALIDDSLTPSCNGGLRCNGIAWALLGLLFFGLGMLCAVVTGLLIVVTGLDWHQWALGVGLALVIFTPIVAFIFADFIELKAFDLVFYSAPGAYFAAGDRGYVSAVGVTLTIMLILAPLPALVFTPGWPGPQLWPRLALTSILLVVVSIVVFGWVVDHYAVAGVGPVWPLLVSLAVFFVCWLVTWLVLVWSLFRWRPAAIS